MTDHTSKQPVEQSKPPSQEPELESLTTEGINPATTRIDQMSALEIARAMNTEDAQVAGAVQRELPHIARAIEEITLRLRQGGRLIYIGAGTSGRLGMLDASECPPTFNCPPGQVIGLIAGGPIANAYAIEDAEDSPEAGELALREITVTALDSVVGIAASGRTPYVLGALHYAQSIGALTIGVVCNPATPMASVSALLIAPIVGPEVITGSTRLKAGTAQKMVLNMLSTGSMILLGKTHGNLMIDVQATNEKLKQRALKVVQLATGLSRTQAEELLQAANGNAKLAVVSYHQAQSQM
jgi:N-acetylmuramic acid 6-phosphate etherase